MRLHLPFSLRKSVLSSLVSMVALSLGSGSACAVTESEPQNLVFDGPTLTWNTDTENKVFTNAAGESASFATGDNVTFASDAYVSLGEDISAGQINIANGADVVIELADNGLNFDTLSMLGGSLKAGDSLNIAAGETLAVGSNGSVLKSDLVLGNDARLSVDYAGAGSATSLNNSALSLQGGTRLQLSGCGNGDGKTYTLLTGVSELKDAQGNAISLNSTNNAIAKYFDTSQPGTGFWADSTLVLTDDGTLQLVRHDHAVMEACTNIPYHPNDFPDGIQYYEGLSHVGNSSSFHGGAIYAWYGFTMSNNGNVEFCGNSSSTRGGAIFADGDITLSDNGSVTFSRNTASSAGGGAIFADGDITLSDNGSVTFSGNTASSSGGAIYGCYGSTITLSNNGSLLFENNESRFEGGAIFASLVLVERNERVLFKENQSRGFGGAIFGLDGVTLSNNGSVEFIGNSPDDYYFGGAISGAVTMSNNGSVLFSGNTAGGGGAIDGYVTMIGNGDVTFRGNAATSTSNYAFGGAIDGGTITLSNNGSVSFNGNRAESFSSYAHGGAICTGGDLSIRNNESVEFYQNAEVEDGTYRLRSIYAGGSGDAISLSAAAGKSIEFRDSVYIASGSTVYLNADYTYQNVDGESVTVKQAGDIIFTGKYAETHLNEILEDDGAGRVATAEEIRNSRTTKVYALTNLHGGCLRVEDGAIYEGYGITAHEGSAATVRVKDATLNHAGYELHFFEGTKLEALGASEIFGDVIVESTATASFSALTRLEGSLTLAAGAELSLDGELTMNGTLTLGLGLTLSGDILADIKNLAPGQSITLVSGLESLTVQMQTLMRSLEYTTVMTGQELVAADYFSNLQTDSGYVLIYNGATGALTVTQSIPEPTTATLSLLALAALAVRRRRK